MLINPNSKALLFSSMVTGYRIREPYFRRRLSCTRDQPDGFQVVIAGRLCLASPIQVLNEVSLAGNDAGMDKIISWISPRIMRRWISLDKCALCSGLADYKIRAQFPETFITFDVNLRFSKSLNFGFTRVAHFGNHRHRALTNIHDHRSYIFTIDVRMNA